MLTPFPAAKPAKRVPSGPELLLRGLGFGDALDAALSLAQSGMVQQFAALATQENVAKVEAFIAGLDELNATLAQVRRLLSELEVDPGSADGDPGTDAAGSVQLAPATDGAA